MTLYDLHLAATDLLARPRVRAISSAVAQYLVLAGAHAALGVMVERSKAKMWATLDATGEPS